MRNTKVRLLAEAAVMLALAIALSFVKIWDMPMGGSVTLLSMLPIMLIAIKNGTAGASARRLSFPYSSCCRA